MDDNALHNDDGALVGRDTFVEADVLLVHRSAARQILVGELQLDDTVSVHLEQSPHLIAGE